MKSGTYEIDFGTKFNKLLNTEEGTDILNTAFQSAWNAYTYDNMDVFYINVEKLTLLTQTTTIAGLSTHRVRLSNGDNVSYLKQNFMSQNKLESKLNLIFSMREEMKKQLQNLNNYDKIKEVHYWLVKNIKYDSNLTAEEPYSVSGALTEGSAVCEGYARAFKFIMDGLDIPCVLVSGTATNSNGLTESHAWNYVYLNNQWYAIDVTWDDPIIIGEGKIPDDAMYQYFLKGKDNFLNTHVEDGYLTQNSIEFKFPTLSTLDY